ncbi:hypothetical protein OUHCRE19_28100 [Enterobacter asburiae]|nr:hypothetical protein ACJ69_10040 [Enterobacter asburiae]
MAEPGLNKSTAEPKIIPIKYGADSLKRLKQIEYKIVSIVATIHVFSFEQPAKKPTKIAPE